LAATRVADVEADAHASSSSPSSAWPRRSRSLAGGAEAEEEEEEDDDEEEAAAEPLLLRLAGILKELDRDTNSPRFDLLSGLELC
jgi:hypothetical protein